MPAYRLTFRLDPRPAPRATTSRTQAAGLEFRRAAYAEIGLKLHSYAWAELDLADPTITARFTEVVGGLQRAGKAVLGAGYLGEVPTAADTAAAEWFGVQTPGHEAGFNLWDDYPECVAGKTPKSWHAVEDGSFVSERFRRVVEESGATGLEFLWVKDTGRFQAMQWYAAVARRPLGHGVDHAWFDRARWEAHVGPRDPVFACAPLRFDSRYFKRGARTGVPTIDEALALFAPPANLDRPGPVHLTGLPRFWRVALPAADFAFLWPDADGPNREGKILRFRKLAVSRRARDTLLREGVLTERACVPFIVLDAIPPGSANLDQGAGDPPPMYPPEELAALRRREAVLRAAFLETPRPRRRASLAASLTHVRRLKRQAPGAFRKGLRPDAIEALTRRLAVPLPAAWRSLVAVTDGAEVEVAVGHHWTVAPLAAVPALHADTVARARASDDDYPEGHLVFASNDSGDYVAFDCRGREVEDCAVILFSHETDSEDYRWSSIAEFLEDWLAGVAPSDAPA